MSSDNQAADTVVLISADAEWNAVRSAIPHVEISSNPYGEYFWSDIEGKEVVLTQGGWGKISAAASTQFVIDQFHPKLLLNLGTCGGFAGSIEIGQTILVNETLVYDIIEQMADPDEAIRFYRTELDLSWLVEPFPLPIIKGKMICADRDIIPADMPMLKAKYNAIASDWESGSIAWVAKRNHIPCMILRTVSDAVDSSGDNFYHHYEDFKIAAERIMATLLKSLPGWLNASSKILT